MSPFDLWESAFYLISKRLCSFVFTSTSEIDLPLSCIHLHSTPFYLSPGKPDSWGSTQSLDVARFNTWTTEFAENTGWPSYKNVRSFKRPPVVPQCSWQVTPLLAGRVSCDLWLYGRSRPQITPCGSCQPRKTHSKWQAEQFHRVSGCTRGRHNSPLMVAKPEVSTALRHTKLQFHQWKLTNPKMTAYPPFSCAKEDSLPHPYLNTYFKVKIMANETP